MLPMRARSKHASSPAHESCQGPRTGADFHKGSHIRRHDGRDRIVVGTGLMEMERNGTDAHTSDTLNRLPSQHVIGGEFVYNNRSTPIFPTPSSHHNTCLVNRAPISQSSCTRSDTVRVVVKRATSHSGPRLLQRQKNSTGTTSIWHFGHQSQRRERAVIGMSRTSITQADRVLQYAVCEHRQ